MEISWALDNDRDAMESFIANFPKVTFECSDIRALDIDKVQNLMEGKSDTPVLFSACAPCQPFTKQMTHLKSLEEDERVQLLSHFGHFVESCLPDFVFVENVPGMQKTESVRNPFSGLLRSLQRADYDVDYRPIRMARYGVPQWRQRLVLVGSRRGPISLPKETHGPGTPNTRYETVRGWISHYPPIGAGDTHDEVPNHRAARLSVLNLKRIKATPEGGSRHDWPAHLRLNCHRSFAGYSDVYGRMQWDSPAPALTTKCISYSNGRFGHPSQDRAVSIREAASLQTFPEDYVFIGSMASMARQIGNAVPVRFASLVGESFVQQLEG